MQTVSLIKGDDRRENIKRSLELLSDEIREGVVSRQIIIKPNFVSTSNPLASSHVDQIRGMLDFLQGFYRKRVIIAEAACGDTMRAYKNFGYLSLEKEYDVELVDLNSGPFDVITIQDSRGRPINIRVSSLLMDKSSYLISAAKLKTHDRVVVTLSIKNMAMGAIFSDDKVLVHQGIKQMNLNIAEAASNIWPDLAVIDGLTGMEGEGPTHGTPVHLGIAISSTDPLAADRVACEVMGADFNKVGYLYYCFKKGLGEGDMENIQIRGYPLTECIRPFRLHSRVMEQYNWRDEKNHEQEELFIARH